MLSDPALVTSVMVWGLSDRVGAIVGEPFSAAALVVFPGVSDPILFDFSDALGTSTAGVGVFSDSGGRGEVLLPRFPKVDETRRA